MKKSALIALVLGIIMLVTSVILPLVAIVIQA